MCLQERYYTHIVQYHTLQGHFLAADGRLQTRIQRVTGAA